MGVVARLIDGERYCLGPRSGQGTICIRVSESKKFATLQVEIERISLRPVEILRAIELLEMAHEAMTGRKA